VYYVLYDLYVNSGMFLYFLFITGWNSSKVLHLIHLYQEHVGQFCSNMIKKKETWQKVTNLLNAGGGQQFTVEEVDKKWRGLRER